MIKRFLSPVILCLSLLPVGLIGQSILVHGSVRNAETGEPLPFANVVFVEQGTGTTTNRLGYFFQRIQWSDTVHVRISYVGYQAFDTLLIQASGEVTLAANLRPISVTMGEVEVLGQSKFYDKGSYPSAIVFQAKELMALPSPGEKDLLRSLQRYPGVSFQSEMSSSIYVRGGSPDQTLIQLDGITVYNPSHVFGFFSMFNMDAVKAAKIMKGGFPAEYGTRVGSVLDILSTEGDRSRFGGKASFGLIDGSLYLNGPIGRGSWMISARRSYMDFLTNTLGIPFPLPDYFFHDLHGRVTQQLDANNRLSATVLYNLDDLDFISEKNNDVIDEAVYSTWSNRLLGIEWASSLSSSAFLRTIVSHSSYHGNLDATQNVLLVSFPGGSRLINYGNNLEDLSVKSELEWSPLAGHAVKLGAFFTKYDLSYSTNASFEERTSEVRRDYSIGGVLVQDEIELTDRITMTPGLRITKYSSRNDPYFEPRLVVGLRVAPTLLVKAGSGIYQQWINGGQPAYFLTFSGIDFWFPVGESIRPPRSTQISADIVWNVQPGLDLTVSGYDSKVENLVELRPNFGESQNLAGVFYKGRGRNFGLEAMLEFRRGAISGMAGYTLSWANRWFDGIDGGREFPARHDKRHVLDAALAFKASKTWEFSVAWTFSSGQAYTGILGYYELGQLTDKISGTNTLHFILSDKNAFRLPYYHRLDLGATKTFDYDSWKLRLRIDVYNAYSRRNALGATTGFSDDPYYRFLPIVPTVTLEAEF